MKKELELLMKLAGKNKFDSELEKLHKKYCNDPKALKQISDFIKSEIQKSAKRIDKIENEISVKEQLSGISDMLNVSYIAKTYFGKSRQWLNHRLNGNIVNGVPAKFNELDLKTFNNALKDISKRIGSLSVH